MTQRAIPLSLARKLAVSKQLLAGTRPGADSQGVRQVFDHLGCIQVDPIRAVEVTQRLVLFSRLGPYPMDLLDQVQFEEKNLFEYWAHAASIVRSSDFPIHRWQFERIYNGSSKWEQRARQWMTANKSFMEYVLAELRERGPLAPNDIEDRSVTPWISGGWSSNRNVTMTLMMLWDTGQIGVARRQGTRKYWDLLERCLPEWVSGERLSDRELTRRAAQISLKALGVASAPQIRRHFTRGRYPQLGRVLRELEKEGVIEQIELTGSRALAKKGPWYIHSEDLALLDSLQTGAWQPRTVLLSPFDNLICDRERTELLFDYHFRIEIYVPKAKRQYGYYVLSLLDGDQIIGRIDPKMDRKSNKLQIQAVYPEAAATSSEPFWRKLKPSVEELATFLGAEAIEYPTEPS